MSRLPCAHCGLPVPDELLTVRAAAASVDDRPGQGEQATDAEPQFCCHGCRQVYGVLHEWGMADYYRLQHVQPGQPTPAHRTGRDFGDFDDPAFAAQNVETTASGTCRASFYLEGVHCAACVWLVERIPSVTDGVVSVRLDLSRARADVEWVPGQTKLSSIGRALDRVGYTPHPYRSRDLARLREKEHRDLLVKLGVAAACAINVMVIAGALYAGEDSGMEAGFTAFFRWISFVVALPVMMFSARPFYRTAWVGLRERVPHVDLPVSIAILVAFAYSTFTLFRGEGPIYFDSISALVALLLGARYVQARAQRAALERAESVRSATLVEFARRISPEGVAPQGTTDRTTDAARLTEVPVEVLRAGDLVEIRTGELVPADGLIREGRSSLDNAVLTGEPTPVAVRPGDFAHAGATNLGAPLVLEVTAVGEETRVGALLRLVEEALAQKTPLALAIDRWSRVFVMVVLALATGTGILWAFLDPSLVLDHVVALLVVSCPCALALATPVTLAISLSRAASRGIFLKSSDVVERLATITTVLLDKTGTLTRGEIGVVAWEGSDRAKAVALAVEAGSAHPIASALRRDFGRPATALEATDLEETPGRGVRAIIEGQSGSDSPSRGAVEVVVGNAEHLRTHGVELDPSASARAEGWAADGLSPLFIAEAGKVIGVAALGDPLRPHAEETVARMISLGLRPRIVSGDHPAVVRYIARQLGIPDADAEGGLTPEEKRARVLELTAGLAERDRHEASYAGTAEQRLSARKERVLMVGDGVNDAAALASAEVGVAVHGGSGAAALAADVVLTSHGVAPVLELIDGAERTRRVIRRNLRFSLVYNIAGTTLAISGMVGPLVAAILMPTSSLTVILVSVLSATFGARTGAAARAKRPPHKGATVGVLAQEVS